MADTATDAKVQSMWMSRSGCFESMSKDPERVAKFRKTWEYLWFNKVALSGNPSFPLSDLTHLARAEKDSDLLWRLELDIEKLAVYHPNEYIRRDAARYFTETLSHERERTKRIKAKIKTIASDKELAAQLAKILGEHVFEILTR